MRSKARKTNTCISSCYLFLQHLTYLPVYGKRSLVLIGRWPFNANKFTDDDSLPSKVTDELPSISDKPNACHQALPISSQLTGCIFMSEGSGDAEASFQEDKKANKQSFSILIVIAGGALDTEI
ncbi:hypothetical protein ACJMK2_044621 [Sinanodonta woodiana]|uniref:Uncharacterized protein n=1 Tax=Sinanodonta woodiana TaxID=1069815 RepID=A0ABD3W0N3_SINWO